MSEHAFSLTAGIIFLLIALGHVRGSSSACLWSSRAGLFQSGSVVALVVTAFLSYEGFRFARRAPPKL